MEEFRQIIIGYKTVDVDSEIASYDGLIAFSNRFYRDVAEIYDIITRLRNTNTNPTGFSLNDAAILGLLVKVWKILKEIVSYYERKNGQMVSLLDRPMVEAIVMAKYLMSSTDEVIEDYRKCSYKDRITVLTESDTSPEFYATKAGQRLKQSIIEKLAAEGLTLDSFEIQKKRRWKLEGKSFRDIFSEVMPKETYKFLYGIGSESIHGSWNESMDFDLYRNSDNTFGANPFYAKPDIRMVTPMLRFANEVYSMWLERINVQEEYITKMFQWLEQINRKLFVAFDKLYVPEAPAFE